MIPEHISLMIVESQPMMRAALSSALSAEGMTVLAEVADSRDALQIASYLTPSLILFSVNYPNPIEMDRISVLRQELPEAKIVVLITGEFRGQYQAALDHGAHFVLTKSTPRADLLIAIQKMAQKRIYSALTPVN